jgi:hypothetical protein
MQAFAGAAFGLSLVLAGCATSPAPHQNAPVEQSALADTEVRRTVLAARTRAWKDPDSIVGAQIADPLLCRNHNTSPATNSPGTTCVCIELNARNSYGGYVGIKREVFAITANGEMSPINYGTVGPSPDLCPNMKPFPELNGRGPQSPKPR